VDKWIRYFLTSDRPTVWFDRADEGTGPRSFPRHYFRCHPSEGEAARTAAEFLSGYGHTTAAYIYEGIDDWEKDRLAAVQRAASRCNPVLHVIGARRKRDDDWADLRASGLAADLADLHSRATAPPLRAAVDRIVSIRDRLDRRLREWSLAPSSDSSPYSGLARYSLAHRDKAVPQDLECDLSEPVGRVWAALGLWPLVKAGAGALISPNDRMAMSYPRTWIRLLGMQAPARLSLLSFDNAYRHLPVGLTSVDFGFDYLGYQAAHAILGDVPVKRDRNGDIPARARVADGGTVGPAPRTGLEP
jgi:DNA-binding LacI/PurR family transcriptional regulator